MTEVTLKKQVSKMPTRKLQAIGGAGVNAAVILSILEHFAIYDQRLVFLLDPGVTQMITLAVAWGAGYLVSDKA